ncbi:MAG TPA: hypothetical protein VHB77_23015 [Planctomycetaceae bacterium]|nr:hypothetical protein [Planctomycetaceae bacterium]
MPTLVTKTRAQIAFDSSEIPADVAGWTDAEFLKALRWKRGAKAALKDAAKAGDVAAFCRAWQDLPAWKSTSAEAPAGLSALWSRGEFPVDEASIADLDRLAHASPPSEAKRGSKNKLAPAAAAFEAWLERHTAISSPLELLFFFDWLPARGSELPTELYWRAWRALTTAVLAVGREFAGGSELSRSLVLDGELPWRIGLLWGDLQGADALRKAGAAALEAELTESTDRFGTPRADLLPCLPLWLAPLVRCVQTAKARGIELWDDAELDHLRNVIERIAPLCLPSGTTALASATIPADRTLLEAAFRVSEWSDAESAIHALFPSREAPVAAKGRRRGVALFQANGQAAAELCLAPSSQSDAARLACLRSTWSARADLLVVGHLGAVPEICLAGMGQPLLSGKLQAEFRPGRKGAPIQGEWDGVCWQSDEDADYLELQTYVRGQCRVDRQCLLSRDGHFALLADVVVATAGDRVDYELRLPLAEGVHAECDTATRECRLTAGDVTARVFPLALPQDRAHSTPGELRIEGNELVLRQAGPGQRLYVPLVIDWHPQRRELPAQWRTLTVSENRATVAPEVASGHRLRLGPQQLMIYRSLTISPEARAVLGYHTRYETVISAVDSDGDMQPILMVE